jgi:hypothetical protein
MIQRHQLLIGLDNACTVVTEGIVEETQVLETGLGDGDGGELVVMQIEDLELREGSETERDVS